MPAVLPSPAAVLWLLNGDLVSEARLASLASSLGPSESERYARFLRPQRAREFLLGRMLLRHAVQSAFGIAGADIAVTEREGNAPQLTLPKPHASSAFHFSLSHSHGWISCVGSTVCAVGVDIEDRNRPRDIAAASAAAFDREETHWVMQRPESQRAAAFYRLWGCKEALYKLTSNQNQGMNEAVYGSGWNCRLFPHERLAICLCSASPLESVKLVELEDI